MGATPDPRSEEPFGAPLAAFARDILREGREAIDDAANADTVAVHDFRKAMKRWRALMRLMEPIVGVEARRLRETARDLARELAAARDIQAAHDALADLGEADEVLSARMRASVARRLGALRQHTQNGTLDAPMRDRLRAALDANGRAVDGWPLAGTVFREVADGLAAGYARARRAIPADWRDATDEALHELRQRVVVHRYQMPLVAPLWPRFGQMWAAEAQRLRERLGACQDLAVLAALAAPHGPLAPWRSRLAPPITARRADHIAAAARLASRLFAERPKAFRRRLTDLWESRP